MEASHPLDVRVGKGSLFRLVEQLESPSWGDAAQSAQQVALSYLQLRPVREALEITTPIEPTEIPSASGASGWHPALTSRTLWRSLPDREIVIRGTLETVVVTLQQRVVTKSHGVDLWGAGIAVTLHAFEPKRFAVTGATSTAFRKAELRPRLVSMIDELLERTAELDARNLMSSLLGLDPSQAGMHDLRPVLFRMPNQDEDLRVGLSALVSLEGVRGVPSAHHVMVDWDERQVVLKTPLATAAATGKVFPFDPVTASGEYRPQPHGKSDQLDPHRKTATLRDLDQVNGKFILSGPRVRIASPNPLGKHPPSRKAQFNFSSRSDNFAAVSAYYHCDAMMRMVEGFGFDLATYFNDVELPLTVIHRAKLLSGPAAYDGLGINAYVDPEVLSGGTAVWRVRMLFGLADFNDIHRSPLGLAADPRWMWHEFCHVLLLASTGKTEFDFAHSAGDALGAVMSDAASGLVARGPVARGVTFPFAGAPTRRHDRCVSCGWGWNGRVYDRPSPTYSARDPAGYRAEQILSSTIFRLYRSTGGEAIVRRPTDVRPDQSKRWSAAHYVAYLIVRAIRALSSSGSVPTNDAEIFAAALQNADTGTGSFLFSIEEYGGATLQTARLGGALHKVIRWAFEQQGLYQPPSAVPVDKPGDPPPIDLFLNDRADRRGEYGPTDDWDASDETLWIRHTADGGLAPQAPNTGQSNYVYINVRNRGNDTGLAPVAAVSVLAAQGSSTAEWVSPTVAGSKWTALPAGAGAVINAAVPSGQTVRFGPFVWSPATAGLNAVLVRVSAPGDRSNADHASPFACAAGPIPIEEFVPYDNNLAYRLWTL
jgi:hypothetical protein